MPGPVTMRFRSWRTKKRRAVERAMRDIADEIVDEIRADLSTPYPPASGPGEPPHRRTGLLAKGVRRSPVSRQKEGAQITIVSERVGYEDNAGFFRRILRRVFGRKGASRAAREAVPGYLEHGTRRMSPRPYMAPAMRRWSKKFLAEIARRVG